MSILHSSEMEQALGLWPGYTEITMVDGRLRGLPPV